ncbi:MAG TPA: hypothetical protein VFA41_02860 [Ktedonobacteraceae bacterium]|jgi:hypothetical protein|nr:hypothetical protein [Ktedonobacteraceae bacterium]
MKQVSVFLGVFRYEFRMQIHRPALWIAFSGLALLFLSRYYQFLTTNPLHLPLLTDIAAWTRNVNFILPVAVGVLMADRLPRDRRYRVEELVSTMPGTLNTRLIGKYLGSLSATLTPMFIYYFLGLLCILYQSHNIQVLPYGLLTFATITLPGMFFVGAFSLACTSLIWVPLYQFLFIGYWFWGNILSPLNGIPTLSETILTPVGGFMASGYFGDNFQLISRATPLQATESLLLLLGTSILVIYALWQILRWQQARQ